MSLSVFLELRFWLLVGFSLVLPVGIYALLLVTRSISRWAVLGFGVALVLIAGVDVYLLQSIAAQAKSTPSLADDAWFSSELTIALYLLPVVFGGIGVNLISHVLLRHLTEAEGWFDSEHSDRLLIRAANTTPLASLSRLVVLLVLPAAKRLARAALLSFVIDPARIYLNRSR